MTFQDYRERIAITAVAESLGYKVNLQKGRAVLEFKHSDGDTVLIDPVKKLYFNRDGTNDRGDLIEFVKNRLNRFNISYQNEISAINKVLQGYANEPHLLKIEYGVPEPKKFDSSRYQIANPSVFKLHYLIQERGLDLETIKRFSPFIHLVKDTEKTKGRPYENIGFPLTKPGSNEVVGYDLRNYGFKGVAPGSDRKNGMWVADFVGAPQRTRNVFFGENPIDLMSFCQLNKHRLDVDNAAFVSFGGGIAKSQLQGAIQHWAGVKIHTAFDNDYQGKMYDIAVAMQVNGKDVPLPQKKEDSLLFQVNGKSFEIPVAKISLAAFERASGIRSGVTVHKAASENNGISFKDFNDIIHPKNATQVSKISTIRY
ncbi:DUF3991 domain-containing protein [Adhaeribacter radiodurans]|uniref:DUF3991 domain-containing protein n=1 Tax=Adhaeribacter radiodurans TaxID=2745197 RepID=A0A7L7L1T6_9BACT|nr:DUF3991 domain-containing protein [Adhaeribacter radiodurans]QMU26555.1 DUF3991 domain-containing protein [Adhaeribacter radiodurans]